MKYRGKLLRGRDGNKVERVRKQVTIKLDPVEIDEDAETKKLLQQINRASYRGRAETVQEKSGSNLKKGVSLNQLSVQFPSDVPG